MSSYISIPSIAQVYHHSRDAHPTTQHLIHPYDAMAQIMQRRDSGTFSNFRVPRIHFILGPPPPPPVLPPRDNITSAANRLITAAAPWSIATPRPPRIRVVHSASRQARASVSRPRGTKSRKSKPKMKTKTRRRWQFRLKLNS